jgi:TRAP-type C4-dicarboxylate transport system substrate-binding protein
MNIRFWFLTLLLFEPTISSAQTTTLIAASSEAPGSTIKGHFMEFEKTLSKTFDGDIAITLLVNGEAGSEETSLSALRRGRIHFSAISVSAASTAVPELSVLMLPYLFTSDEEADFVLDNFVFSQFQSLFKAKGLTLIRWLDSGWAVIYSQKPIIKPEDAKGYRMRSASAVPAQAFLRAVGADVIPLSFSDIIPALQTGLIDGGSTSPFMFLTAGIFTYAKELTLSRHALNPGTVIANTEWLTKLSTQNQKAVEEAYAPSSLLRADTRQQTCDAYKTLRGRGVRIHELSADQEKMWRATVVPTHRKVVSEIGGQAELIYSAILEGKAAFTTKGIPYSQLCRE